MQHHLTLEVRRYINQQIGFQNHVQVFFYSLSIHFFGVEHGLQGTDDPLKDVELPPLDEDGVVVAEEVKTSRAESIYGEEWESRKPLSPILYIC